MILPFGWDLYDDLAKELGADVLRKGRARPALAKNGIVVEFNEQHLERLHGVKFRAKLPHPGVPSFRIYPEGFQSFMSKLFGGQDVELGHATCDMMFMVKAREPELVKRLWRDEACDLLVAMRDAWIEGDEEEISLSHRLEFDEEPKLREGLRLLFVLGATDVYGLDVVRRLPEAQWHSDRGEAWLPGPGNLRVGFIRYGTDRVSTAIWASAENVTEISGEVSARFEQLGAAIHRKVGGEPYLLVVWAGVQRDDTKLVRAVEALRRLVGGVPGDGVFR